MVKKILVATEKPFAGEAITEIKLAAEAVGSEYELVWLEKYKKPEELYAAVEDADAIIIRSDLVTPEVLEAGKKLKIVVRAGAGYDNVDLAAATKKGVVVMNTPGQNSNAVAELAFGLLFTSVRNRYNGSAGWELRGKVLGLQAYGNVGRYMSLIAKGAGMEVLAFDPYIPAEAITKDGVEAVSSLEELYTRSRILSLHIPSTKETKNSVNYEWMMKLPKGAILLNTARADVIDFDGLVKAMKERNDLRYLTDVRAKPEQEAILKEVLGSDFEKRYMCTEKKMGAQTAEANINAGVAAVEQIVAFFEKNELKFKVN